MHVRSVEQGSYFGTLSLDEPMALEEVVLFSECHDDWGYHMDSLEFGFEVFERELDASWTLDVGAGVTDTAGDVDCTNMGYR